MDGRKTDDLGVVFDVFSVVSGVGRRFRRFSDDLGVVLDSLTTFRRRFSVNDVSDVSFSTLSTRRFGRRFDDSRRSTLLASFSRSDSFEIAGFDSDVVLDDFRTFRRRFRRFGR